MSVGLVAGCPSSAEAAAELVAFEQSSGKVLADLGWPDATELHAKVSLAMEINRQIRKHRLTPAAAAECLEASQSEIGALRCYKLDGFSYERLMSFMVALGPGGRVFDIA